MDLLYGELPGERVGGALLDVSLDQRLLNLELFLREFKYAVLVNLISNLPEEIGDIPRGCRWSSSGSVGLLGRAAIGGQQQKRCHRCAA